MYKYSVFWIKKSEITKIPNTEENSKQNKPFGFIFVRFLCPNFYCFFHFSFTYRWMVEERTSSNQLHLIPQSLDLDNCFNDRTFKTENIVFY